MTPHLPLRLGTALLATLLFFGGKCTPNAEGHGGGGHGGGGGHAGGGHAGGHMGGHPGYAGGGYHHSGYGGYHGGYYGGYHGGYYGGYAPFGYGLGAGLLLGTGLGYGLGSGLYRPYYGSGYGAGGYGLGAGGYGVYPYSAGYGAAGPAVVGPAGAPLPGLTPPPANRPPADDAAHLELVVPEDAEVLFDGQKTSQKGRVRHFVSPALTPNKLYTYEVVVRYTDASGKVVTDRRNIDVRANDWFNIDFTRPAPKTEEPPPAAP